MFQRPLPMPRQSYQKGLKFQLQILRSGKKQRKIHFETDQGSAWFSQSRSAAEKQRGVSISVQGGWWGNLLSWTLAGSSPGKTGPAHSWLRGRHARRGWPALQLPWKARLALGSGAKNSWILFPWEPRSPEKAILGGNAVWTAARPQGPGCRLMRSQVSGQDLCPAHLTSHLALLDSQRMPSEHVNEQNFTSK